MKKESALDKGGKRFALVLTEHRLWGNIFLPFIFISEPGKKFFRLTESLSPFQAEDTLKLLVPEEREMVRIINEYNDRALFKLFSRDKNVKDFLLNVTPEKISQFIRPFIERRMRKCFLIARDEGIVCFRKPPNSNVVHANDEVIPDEESAFPVFIFNRYPEGSTYRLRIESCGKSVELFKNDIEILTDSPCIIRERSRLLSVADIDGQKLRPFLTREYISIPKESEIKYFSGFVLNTVNRFRVDGSGFTIVEPESEKRAHLSLEESIRGFALILSFYYSGNCMSPEDTLPSFTKFTYDSGEFIFNKFHRDFDWERTCIDTLTNFGFETADNVNFHIPYGEVADAGGDIGAMVEAINRIYVDLTESGFTITQRSLTRNYNLNPVNIEISSKMEGDWFDLRAIIKIDKWEIPFIQLRHNILEGIREYELPDGTCAILPREWFTKYRNLFEFGNEREDHIKVHKQHFPLLSGLMEDDDSEQIKQLEKLLIPEHLPDLTRPAGMKCEMRDYQIKGLNWLSWLQSAGLGGCLADDMGLGKTIQALAMLQNNAENSISETGKSNDNSSSVAAPMLFDFPVSRITSLIIVPATLVYNWENEIRRFVPGMKVYTHKGIGRTKSARVFGMYDIVLTNYHIIRQDIDLLRSFKFHYVILDESQSVKNPGSLTYKCVTSLRSEFRLALSGTPIENSLTDLWAQLNFINPGLLGTLSYFQREFARPIEKAHDLEKEERLKKIIMPFILRRTKEMVASDLPPVTEQTVYCDMTEDQGKIYEEEKSAVRNSILSGTKNGVSGNQAILVLQGLMKLRQISNHPVLAEEGYQGSSGKYETVLSDVENVIAEGHKILLFSSFVMHLKLFANALEKKKTGYSILTGASTNRDRIIKGFQNDVQKKVFLISLKAGGVGLNLTAADYVFILDPWWNPASEMQALSRAHRIGQDKNVFVYRYISTGTLEEKITRLQENKSKLAGSFIQNADPLKDMDLQQILDLIG